MVAARKASMLSPAITVHTGIASHGGATAGTYHSRPPSAPPADAAPTRCDPPDQELSSELHRHRRVKFLALGLENGRWLRARLGLVRPRLFWLFWLFWRGRRGGGGGSGSGGGGQGGR